MQEASKEYASNSGESCDAADTTSSALHCSHGAAPVAAPWTTRVDTHTEYLPENDLDYTSQSSPHRSEKRCPKSTSMSRQGSLTVELTNESRVYREIRCCGSRINPEFVLTTNEVVDVSDPYNNDHYDDVRRTPTLNDTTSANTCKIESIWKPRGLTLSAYRRPENTIRLTKTDPMRRVESEYDLHCPGSSGVLGHGAYSTVRLAVRLRDGVQVAVKSIAKHEALRSSRLRRIDDNGSCKNYMEEWEILRRLHDHPYVITLLDVFETTDEIQLVTEFCPGGELFDAIQKHHRRQKQIGCNSSEKQAALITSQILQALATLHALGIVHRDVKPENILLTKPLSDDSIHVKLCDFGVARPLVSQGVPNEEHCVISDGEASPLTPGSRSRSFSIVGTDYYAAPELTYGNVYNTAVDIYSLGVTLYILLCGFPPVFGSALSNDEDEDHSAFDSVDEVLFPDVYWSDISPKAKSLVKSMLHPNPSLRIDAKDAQQDPWIQYWIKASSPTFSSCIPTNPTVDLNLVSHELYKSMMGLTQNPQKVLQKRRRNSTFIEQIPMSLSLQKRTRMTGFSNTARFPRRAERRSSTTALMALADLYRGVAAPSVVAAAAVAAATATNTALTDGHTERTIDVIEMDDSLTSSNRNEVTEEVFVKAKSPLAALSF